jgi:hypothetical protein
MAPFAAYVPSDYRAMTMATLDAVSNQTAADTNIKNQYFGDLATNRFSARFRLSDALYTFCYNACHLIGSFWAYIKILKITE